MKFKLKFAILSIFLFCNSFIFPQQNPAILGFRFEGTGEILSKEGKPSFEAGLPSFYALIGVKTSPKTELNLRPGFSMVDDFTGFEIGTYIEYFPSETGLKIIGGVNFHFNATNGHSTHENNHTTFVLPGIGAGYTNKDNFSIELIFYYPFPQEFTEDLVYTGSNEIDPFKNVKTNLNGLIKLGVGFAWDL